MDTHVDRIGAVLSMGRAWAVVVDHTKQTVTLHALHGRVDHADDMLLSATADLCVAWKRLGDDAAYQTQAQSDLTLGTYTCTQHDLWCAVGLVDEEYASWYPWVRKLAQHQQAGPYQTRFVVQQNGSSLED